MAAASAQRGQVIALYKQLIYLARDYPKDPRLMQRRIHDAFMRNKDLTDKSEIEQWIKKGEYIQGELEALYMLRKYRTMKNRYYDKD